MTAFLHWPTHILIIFILFQIFLLHQWCLLFLLYLQQFLLPIVHHELLDPHVPASHADYQAPIDNLSWYLLRPKLIIVLPRAFHRYRAPEPVDIVSKQLIHQVSHDSLIQFAGSRLLLQPLTHTLVLCLRVFNAFGHVFQLPYESYDTFLGLPVHFK
jgi:hypothetical protein